ncbi:MAG: hypothetical protein ACOX5G_11925 [Kiritimatiellia bacterium]|jgi:opacity protein-like surface antigen
MKQTLLLSAAIVLAASGAAHADLLAYENFDYPTDCNLHGQNGASGWLGAWSAGCPGQGYMNQVRDNIYSFSYAGYTPETEPALSGGNYLNLAAGYGGPNFNYAQRTLDLVEGGVFDQAGLRVVNSAGYACVGADGATLWGSFLLQSASNCAHLWLQEQDGASSTRSTELQLPNLGSVGAIALVVFRIDFGGNDADAIHFWYNPDLSCWQPTDAPASTVQGNLTFRNFVFVQNGQDTEARYDDIRLGTAAEDVVPYYQPPAGTVFILR